MKAEDVIARAARKTDQPSKKALAELKKLCDHNDNEPVRLRRVSRADAMKLLTANGFTCSSHSRLDRVCRLFGRRSYVQK